MGRAHDRPSTVIQIGLSAIVVMALACGGSSGGPSSSSASRLCTVTAPQPCSGSSPVTGGPVRIAYLHHSTGANIWGGGVPDLFSAYNTAHGTQYQITSITYPDTGGGYPWANYPYDYWNLWVNHTGTSQDHGELNLDQLVADHDVVIFKHCFPVSGIEAESGTPSAQSGDVTSQTKTESNYMAQYTALKARLTALTSKKFVVWTGAALPAGQTDAGSAQRARHFFGWVKNTWDTHGDNVFVWDFDALETEGGLYMKDDYTSGGDPHPNATFSQTVAPCVAQRIIDVIEGCADRTNILGIH